jgi:hypothetical protein
MAAKSKAKTAPARPKGGSRALTEVQLEALKLQAAMLADARAAYKTKGEPKPVTGPVKAKD